MPHLYQLNSDVVIDLEEIITVTSTEQGLHLTFRNREQRTVEPLSNDDRQRFLEYLHNC